MTRSSNGINFGFCCKTISCLGILQCMVITATLCWAIVNMFFIARSNSNILDNQDLKLYKDLYTWEVEGSELAYTNSYSTNDSILRSERILSDVQSQSRIEYPNANIWKMHGDIGLLPSNEPAWISSNPPENIIMSVALKNGGGFNLYKSDSLPLDRNVTDYRHNECKNISYDLDKLEGISVIIVFYNEPFSTLMRSVHSVLNRTPPKILREIVLVDDGSDLDYIKENGNNQLVNYLKTLPKTRLIRNPKRMGIVAARLAGIRASISPIFVILDSHIEVQPVWAEPLIQRIQEDPRRILMPQIDSIDSKTFEFIGGGIGCTLGFLWKLIEHAFPQEISVLPLRREAKSYEYVTSPTMAGGLLAANKAFFTEIGSYDPQFEYWGTENLELSFRTWMCGGIIECAPCSRVFHVFRKGGVGYSSPSYAVLKNKLRTLYLWMDEFGDLAWRVMGKPRINLGPLEERQELRKRLQCKSFKWFLENVNPESEVKSLDDVPFLGFIKNVESNQCLDNAGTSTPGGHIKLWGCHGGDSQSFMYFKSSRHWMVTSNDESCLTEDLSLNWCNSNMYNWDLLKVNGTKDTYIFKSINKCLSVENRELGMFDCNLEDKKQWWQVEPYGLSSILLPPPDQLFKKTAFRGS
ncbi:glycosyl transferase [Cryptosporidium muris RN66]|uniref:Glycosyl transferase, group 2 family protein n=1 Tax=Cryptosporidium muris (strain RN66) TaxID=441375 RepID=B6AEY6_CRYMR|nr:glycosyl transferase [Cryptosporidium muris RN66]EEA06753.1 glycosyl transferase, group 2 family protein [Cryptosporidium muris RN66]|eukprot:XP_002141102.1 glycosyl transferase [Cryptosporidium muris RN66]